jgi:co-chaperonin GroES (HSP10)
MESKYFEKFKSASKLFKITGNKILVERLDLGEIKSSGGLIISDSSNIRADLRLQKGHIALVLAVGEGYFDADANSYTPLDVKPGNIVILNQNGAYYFSAVPGATTYTSNTVGISTEADVQFRFEGLEDFKAYSDIMSSGAK